jgi:acyl-ACP thioesterase
MQDPIAPYAERVGFAVGAYAIDARKRLTVPALIRFMQEAAMINVIRIKLSVWDLEQYAVSWVLLYMYVDIYRLPVLGEQLEILTFPAGMDRLYTYRDFKVFDADGTLVAQASSTWLLMDTQRRRPTRLPQLILDAEPYLPAAGHRLPPPDFKLDPPAELAGDPLTFRTGYHDLDFNEHLNNVRYVPWMLESLPVELLSEGELRRMELQYIQEVLYGQTLQSVRSAAADGAYVHELRRGEQAVARMRTYWK